MPHIHYVSPSGEKANGGSLYLGGTNCVQKDLLHLKITKYSKTGMKKKLRRRPWKYSPNKLEEKLVSKSDLLWEIRDNIEHMESVNMATCDSAPSQPFGGDFLLDSGLTLDSTLTEYDTNWGLTSPGVFLLVPSCCLPHGTLGSPYAKAWASLTGGWLRPTSLAANFHTNVWGGPRPSTPSQGCPEQTNPRLPTIEWEIIDVLFKSLRFVVFVFECSKS